ncbi:MAG: hypothetical protein Q4P13_10005, partial [Psychrobacter sp.]|nr:hypothetical protein [Psychrobacter sp.]
MALNIVIENTGNLPAKDIVIKANRQDVLNCTNGNVIPKDAKEILLSNLVIPILANGKKTINAFHCYGENVE